ncbi:chemotaxis protein CheW [Oceanospirillaceae bacterium ASx5O]|nr:chemotaxis protein CheW [Oceanospirillaceae bacterium ASx5O]
MPAMKAYSRISSMSRAVASGHTGICCRIWNKRRRPVSKADVKPVVLHNHVDGVLQDYLDQLLVTATVSPAVQAVPVVMPAPVVAEAPQASSVVAVPVSRTRVIPATPAPAVPATIVTEPPAVAVAETETAALLSTKEALDWRSSQGIECLIFKVAGLKLAIPLPLLGGVYPVTDKVTPLFGQAAWSLGVWQGDDVKLTIIDSAVLIMPERGVQLRETGYQFFIQLDRSPWALACQEICDTVTLGYDSVKWRGESSKRPWLAGTVIDEMCALLDVPGIQQLLEAQRRPGANRH